MPKLPEYNIPIGPAATPNQTLSVNVDEGAVNKFGINQALSLFNVANDAIQDKYKKIKEAERINKQSEITLGFMRDADSVVNSLKGKDIEVSRAVYNDFFKKKFDEVSGLDLEPEDKAKIAYDINRMSFGFEKSLLDDAETLQKQKNLAALEQTLFESEKLAASSTDPVKRSLYTNNAISQINTLINNGTISPDIGQKRMMQFKEQVQLNTIQKAMLASPTAALSMVRNKDMVSAVSAENLIKLENLINTDIKQGKAKLSAEIGNAYEKMLKYDITSAEKQAIEQSIALYGDKDTRDMWDSIQKTATAIQSLDKTNPAIIRSLINDQLLPATRKDGATKEEIMLLNAAQDKLKYMESEINKNYIDYDAAVRGGMPMITTEDLMSDDNSKFVDRINSAKGGANIYNKKLKIFTNLEAENIEQDFSKFDSKQIMYAMNKLSGYGGDVTAAMARQINEKNPALAGAIAIAKDNPLVAAKIYQGSKIDLPNLKNSDIEKQFYATIKDSVSDPDALKSMEASVTAYYKTMADVNLESVDTKKYEQAFSAIVGNVFPVNDKNVLGYIRPNGKQADENDFNRVIYNMNESDIINAAGSLPMDKNGNSVTADDIRERARFRTLGNGNYIVYYNDDFALLDSKGNDFVINMPKLESIVTDRYSKKSIRPSGFDYKANK